MTGRCTCVMLPTDPPKWDGRQCKVHWTVADRCACRPLEIASGSRNPTCPEHGSVDTILASGTYADRRGRVWRRNSSKHSAVEWCHEAAYGARGLDDARMRTLIERDMHRAVCPGLRDCDDHPVPVVTMHWPRWPQWWLYATDGADTQYEEHPTLGAALDAARHMTGATP